MTNRSTVSKAFASAFIILLISFAASGAEQDENEISDPELRLELLEMMDRDQAMRAGPYNAEIDHQNTARLKEIIGDSGWPTIKMVGRDGSKAAWLLAQHADHDPEFQQYVLTLLEPLAKNGEISPANYAYLYDRTHEPQLFATQGACYGEKWEPREIADVEHLEKRRAEYGMEPFAESQERASNYLCKN